jgi:predicted phage terminase large subunit-like protein
VNQPAPMVNETFSKLAMTNDMFTKAEIELMLANLHLYSDLEVGEINNILAEIERREYVRSVYDDLLTFCEHIFPEYMVGKHHVILADMLMDIDRGVKDRICVNIPPRHGKSMLDSTAFPAWYLGRNPGKQVMLVSHTTDLAVDFGRKVRNNIATDRYKEIFPDVRLATDSKSAGRWNTNHGGSFYACGVGSALAGRGADLLIIDDPHSEQDVLNGNFEVFDRAYEWYTFGARTRLMPGGSVAIIQTRWHLDDLTGRVLRDMGKNPGSDQFEVVEFPAILEFEDEETGVITEKALWPDFFDLPALHRTKATMPLFQWNAQFQQNPTAEEAALVKRDWWNIWSGDEPPDCEYVIVTLDAAAETHNRADFTGITTWGVFLNEEVSEYHIILLDSIKDRYEFPELKRKAMEVYEDVEPDAFIVEKKSAGTALYQEMRRMGIPVQEYTPHRGSGDKLARLNSVSDIVSSGMVWVPETRWAEELVDEVASFPFGSNDDLVDCTTMALMRFRQGGFIRLPSDMPDEVQFFKSKRGGAYY